MTDQVRIPVSADFDGGSVDKAVQDLVQKINRLGESVAQANKLKFNPVDKAALDDLKRLQAQYESLVKISAPLRKRLGATGQSKSHFADVDWERAYADSPNRGAAIRRSFEYAAKGTAFEGRFQAPPAPPAPPAAPPAPGGGGGQPPAAPPPGPGTFPGHGVVNAGLNAAGPVGRAAAGGLNAGLKGGLGVGLGAFGGMLAAAGISKAVGMVMDKTDDAESEAIGFDTLKRQLGDVGIAFADLRDSVRQSAKVLDTNFNEALGLAGSYVKQANIGSGGARNVAGELKTAGGFARGFGLDLGAGVSFMAQMRMGKVTGNDQDAKRLALMIGEAVAKIGFAKTDEVLAAVTSYTQGQARNSLSAPNVGGFLSAMSGLSGSGKPGLDAQGSAGLLMRVNSAISSGGAAGEAGQNFFYSKLGRDMGLSPIQTKLLQEQGAFGTGRSAFGEGSVYADFSKKFGGSAPAAANSDKTNLSATLKGLQASYSGDYLAAATSNLLGVNLSQGMALHAYGEGGALNGIQQRLGRARGGRGIGLNEVNASGIESLARINSGSAEDLTAQARSLASRTGSGELSADERKRLDAAMSGGDSETMRDVLTELTATRSQEETDGSKTRESIESVARETQKLATVLLTPLNKIRDGISAIAEKLAPDSAYSKAEREMKTIQGRDAAVEKFGPDSLGKFDDETKRILSLPENASPARQHQIQITRDLARKNLEATGPLEMMRAGVGRDGDADSLMGALIRQESGGRHIDPATGKLLENKRTGALGITQVMPGTGQSPGFGVKPLQDQGEDEYKRFGRDYLAAMLRRYGGDSKKALGAYNYGPGNVDKAIGERGDDWMSAVPTETRNYVTNILKTKERGADSPPGQRPNNIAEPGAGVGPASGRMYNDSWLSGAPQSQRPDTIAGPVTAPGSFKALSQPSTIEVDVLVNTRDAKSGQPVGPQVVKRISKPAPVGAQQ